MIALNLHILAFFFYFLADFNEVNFNFLSFLLNSVQNFQAKIVVVDRMECMEEKLCKKYCRVDNCDLKTIRKNWVIMNLKGKILSPKSPDTVIK